MRSSFHVRTPDDRRGQRGYVLITAIILAVLYFGLMELMLIDSSRALQEAQRFRSRIVAQTLAENAAELAAVQIVSRASGNANAENEQGTMVWTQKRSDFSFEITGKGTSAGVQQMTATVQVQGKIDMPAKHVTIDYTYHSQ